MMGNRETIMCVESRRSFIADDAFSSLQMLLTRASSVGEDQSRAAPVPAGDGAP